VLKLQIIIGSTRPGRAADLVTPWVIDRARSHDAFDVEVLDLRDWPLPLFAEHAQTIGDPTDPTFSDPIVRAWNKKIAQGDAYVMITPEYLHSVPAVLKNAIDSIFVTYAFRNKPATFIGYSGGLAAGVRAIEHLALIAIEAELVPMRNTVIIPSVQSAFTDGEPKDPLADISLRIALDDLAWYGRALQRARAEGELAPGIHRRRAAMAAQSPASR
jgi:NAD(P)H-dependent FMN reductase